MSKGTRFFLVLFILAPSLAAWGDVVDVGSFPASRYESLWQSSPFAVASPDMVESVQYALVGAAEFDGVFYASIVDKNSSDHFVVSTSRASHGLSLVSITHGQDKSTFATLSRDGALLRLKLESMTPTGDAAAAANSTPRAIILAPPVVVVHRGPPRAHSFRSPVYVPIPGNASQ